MPRLAETHTTAGQAQWYKDAIIYQIHVRAFADSNGDGIGDFRGLTSKLDYIQELGVTAIWLLPFFPSPLRDGGYDMSDYRGVHPNYGTLRDFRGFLEAAHERGIRVITEMVMNHTSDQHEWFQKSRQAKPGSPWRDYYVWSDSPDRYQDARIIFQDFESSNWTWDPVANAYFWHRFYSHQPDLNFENPAVQQAMFDAVDFWLDMGVDGLRLDAIPYLFEEEGTNCENLPKTHEFLKSLRSHVDEKYGDRMLLAEANQWPEDAAAYFGEGDGDECQMNFHFPLMPRLYMAVEREDRFPIIDILEQTPELPETSQWAIFLRNHDELTLEMVTDEERDYMYRAYAEDPRARVNLGIRRRLAPLLRNNRRKIELMNGLLMSLPGTPVVYYGDEIGMGDNIFLGDRDGVRTPMQWSPDRNAGFSQCNPQRLYLPVIIDTEYHYSSINVEVEANSPHSQLWWMRRIIHLRRDHQVFGRGRLEFLQPDNSKVLAYIRESEDETILVVANLSRFTQCAELDLSRFRGRTPTELFGKTDFPPIGELPYFLSLGPYGFYWFKLSWKDSEVDEADVTGAPRLRVSQDWTTLLAKSKPGAFENALASWLPRHRWFGGKARTIQTVKVEESIPLGDSETEPIAVIVVRVEYTEGEPERYMLPLIFADEERARNIVGDHPRAKLAEVENTSTGEVRTLCEAVWESEFWQPLFAHIKDQQLLSTARGEFRGAASDQFAALSSELGESPEPSVHGGQQSNTSAIFGDSMILKLFRKIAPGVNPDLEISQFLSEFNSDPENEFQAPVAPLAGSLEFEGNRDEAMTLAIMQGFVPNEGDAWVYTLDELGRYYERLQSAEVETSGAKATLPRGKMLQSTRKDIPDLAHDLISPYLQSVELLGQRTAEMHLALASNRSNPAFAPEGFTKLYQRSLYQSMRAGVRKVMTLLKKQRSNLSDELLPLADRVLAGETELMDRYKAVAETKIAAQRIRCHGDYHLGQVLYTGRDFVIIDFEGEPDRTIGERKIKQTPLKDVAGMIRSLHYASFAARFGQVPGGPTGPEAGDIAERWMQFWYAWCVTAYLKSYLASATSGEFLPQTEEGIQVLLDAYILEKAIYELGYELNNRPDWVQIPLVAIIDLLEA
ncbi:maltose alpha-D-glucosyltransferase [Thalassoroseus pseudoceratinae]|uniref:maltose alpha-D-glucosyltransferase n=1 Tax=Thalassoroseus pseudoceratinae TaxID=2713176 RepID=UPI0014223F6D|nr:maltose alpha-D-glucosyltransferase [Thalassoroseus pseudoceratinae]